MPGRLRRLGAPGRVGSVPVRLPENQSWFFHQGSVLVHLPGAPSLFVCPGLGPGVFTRARSRFHLVPAARFVPWNVLLRFPISLPRLFPDSPHPACPPRCSGPWILSLWFCSFSSCGGAEPTPSIFKNTLHCTKTHGIIEESPEWAHPAPAQLSKGSFKEHRAISLLLTQRWDVPVTPEHRLLVPLPSVWGPLG